MEILETYEFKRPSTSRYAPVVEVLAKNPTAIVKLRRGEDFPADAKVSSVQGAVSTQIRENGAGRARTFVESDDVIVVALWPEGEGPRARKRPAKRPAQQQLSAA